MGRPWDSWGGSQGWFRCSLKLEEGRKRGLAGGWGWSRTTPKLLSRSAHKEGSSAAGLRVCTLGADVATGIRRGLLLFPPQLLLMLRFPPPAASLGS